MSCLTMSSDVLLYNFFRAENCPFKDGVDLETLNKYSICLRNNLPTYLFVDTTMKGYKNKEVQEMGIYVVANKVYCPYGLERFSNKNDVYTKKTKEQIETITREFFARRLYEKELRVLTPVRAS